MSDHWPLPLSSSWVSYNHWKRLFQLAWETAEALVLTAPDIMLLPHYWGHQGRGRWLSYQVIVSDLWKTMWITSCLTQRAIVNCNPSCCSGITLGCVKSLIETVFKSYFTQLRTVGHFSTWLWSSTYYVLKMQLWIGKKCSFSIDLFLLRWIKSISHLHSKSQLLPGWKRFCRLFISSSNAATPYVRPRCRGKLGCLLAPELSGYSKFQCRVIPRMVTSEIAKNLDPAPRLSF